VTLHRLTFRRPIVRALLRAWVGASVAVALVLGLAFAGVLAASPEVHEHVHQCAHDHDHVCAATLVDLGFCDTSGETPVPVATFSVTHRGAYGVTSFRWANPDFWLQPALAPPTVL
jgi:hypothetical protein